MIESATVADMPPSADPRQLVLAGPMSAYQIVAVAVTGALCVFDGFDVMAITFAAPAIAADWGIGKAALGYVLSAGLLGMAGGSLLIAPAADVLGRRRLIYASLIMTIIGTFWTAGAHQIGGLLASRIMTGLGIGTMISVINPLTAEYANARRRDLSLSIVNICLPLGSVLGGFLATFLLPTFGWRAIFICAGAMGLAMMPAVWLWLPEPVCLIIARPGSNALAKVNAYLRRCGLEGVSRLPPPPPGAAALPIINLFRDRMAGATLTLTGIYFLYIMTMFYMQSWIPTLVTSAGFSPAQGAMVSVCANVGGVIGGLCFGAATLRGHLKPMALGAFVIAAAMTATFGLLPPKLAVLAGFGAVTGFFLFGGGVVGVYAVISRTFPTHMRASGTGWVVGIGRLGSALGPTAAGLLFSAGLARSGVSFVMSGPALLAAILLLTFKVRAPTVA